MQKLMILVVAGSLFACPAKPKSTKKITGNPSTQSTSAPVAQPEDEEIGLLFAQLAPLSDQAACVYGGWTCPSGEQFGLLKCTTDGGKTFADVTSASECGYLKDYQISRDGSTAWFSCEAKTGAPHLVRSTDKAQSFSFSEAIAPNGELLAWAFSSSKNGLAIIAAEGEAAERGVVYIEKSTADGGSSWKPLLEIKGEFAAQFNPEVEVNRKPPQEIASPFVMQKRSGPDGGPAYQINDAAGKQQLFLAWRDIPGKCSPAASLPTEEILPGIGPVGPGISK
jgi:hypothetical protein